MTDRTREDMPCHSIAADDRENGEREGKKARERERDSNGRRNVEMVQDSIRDLI